MTYSRSAFRAGALVLAMGATSGTAPRQAPSYLRELFTSGVRFADFLAAATSRRHTWNGNFTRAVPPDTLRERLAALSGRWRLLVVAEAWCGDSANTLPYIARLIDGQTNVDLRIVDSTRGRAVMEAHLTADGRAATPTVLVLDAEFAEAGCLVEQPAPLAAWSARMRASLSGDELHERQRAWYNWERGEQTMTEIVELLEAAAAGKPRCPHGAMRQPEPAEAPLAPDLRTLPLTLSSPTPPSTRPTPIH